jgi:hypothetical protein
MTLTLFFLNPSDCTTHALLNKSISHKTATEAETIQSTDCDVVTERLGIGMVVRGRDKKGKGQVQLLRKKI